MTQTPLRVGECVAMYTQHIHTYAYIGAHMHLCARVDRNPLKIPYTEQMRESQAHVILQKLCFTRGM